ncbi:MAG: efflux RND transporter periplasmic adaptor subunit [Desulfomonilaceae bacterium]|nr:efflux RND transporter periplasmic adaptor subunit [Desulfomonilaceae bacterium]
MPSRPLKKLAKAMVLISLVGAAFGLGYFLSGSVDRSADVDSRMKEAQHHDHEEKTVAKSSIWTCSMHPQIRLPKPGKCPICFMDLIPLTSEDTDSSTAGLTTYTMSETAKRLAEVETDVVKREQAKVVVRMVGMVFEDETRIAALTSRVDGRLDEIYVNFTGTQVKEGDPMVKIWSPTLITSQVELFEATRSSEPDEDFMTGAEEKLIQQGLTREQVERIKLGGKPILYVTLRAPISGVVMKRIAVLGQFVKEGTEMYSINDLSHVWIKMDAYETDLPWIRYGQDVTFTTPALPGKRFKGKVLFIDPTLEGRTRSVKIRVEASNPDLLLKPGMFVSAELEAEIDAAGKVVKSEWTGKYICPVHPRDQPSSEPGICPDSKVPLKPASAFGYSQDDQPELPLVIPATAPLITGTRAIVYVEVPGAERPTYELRQVVLGPRAGDKYVVYEGLKEGDRVVVKGNFKIDSAMQILARPSMMNEIEGPEEGRTAAKEEPREEEAVARIEAPRDFIEKFTPVFSEYLALKDALVEERTDLAVEHSQSMGTAVEVIDTAGLSETAARTWKDLSAEMTASLDAVAAAEDVEGQRKAFAPLSEALARALMSFRHVRNEPIVLYHCPMSLDEEGAYWMESTEDPKNPYFGRKPYQGQVMLQCGEILERIPGVPPAVSPTGEAHDSSETDRTGSSGGGAGTEESGMEAAGK